MCVSLVVTTNKMHLIFVLLFVGGCTIQGTQSFSYPPGAKEILIGGSCLSYPPGRSCKKDYQCGVGGSCEYIGKSLMKYLTILLHL